MASVSVVPLRKLNSAKSCPGSVMNSLRTNLATCWACQNPTTYLLVSPQARTHSTALLHPVKHEGVRCIAVTDESTQNLPSNDDGLNPLNLAVTASPAKIMTRHICITCLKQTKSWRRLLPPFIMNDSLFDSLTIFEHRYTTTRSQSCATKPSAGTTRRKAESLDL